jgi:hypothetical protein
MTENYQKYDRLSGAWFRVIKRFVAFSPPVASSAIPDPMGGEQAVFLNLRKSTGDPHYNLSLNLH